MTKYQCDRCLTLGEKPLQQVEIPKDETKRYYINESEAKSVDLCPPCVKALREFIKPLPQVAKG